MAVRVKFRLQSTESSHSYTSTKNPRTNPDKKELNKYDPILRKHVKYKEEKIKK